MKEVKTTEGLTPMGEPSRALPSDPELYHEEYEYWPWGRVLQRAAALLIERLPPGATVVDYMCGTGRLLDLVSAGRPDLTLIGVDWNSAYIDYAMQKVTAAIFTCADATYYEPPPETTAILCTAGLHHLPYSAQLDFLRRIAGDLVPGGLFLLGEELVGTWQTKKDRALQALALGSALLTHCIQAEAPERQVEVALELLRADVLQRGEYKLCRAALDAMVAPFFAVESCEQIWPAEKCAYGDWLYLCQALPAGR